jgi:peptide/nickel transport system substrate-binding protein
MGNTLRNMGRPIPTGRAELLDMFGHGTWRYDPEGASRLFHAAGLELRDDGWYFEGEPFTITLNFLADTELQAGRGVQAMYDQLMRFGFTCFIESDTGSAFWDREQEGNFQLGGYWPTYYVITDIANGIQGWSTAVRPLGERGAGNHARWDNPEQAQLIRDMLQLAPDDPRNLAMAVEWFKIAIEDLPFIGFHAGVKFVPYSTTYWDNFPTAANPYNGPWWWWSCFKYIVVELKAS